MAIVTKKVDALGFDRNQIASIRRAYASNKMNYKKMDVISEKIQELYKKYEALEKMTESWDAPAKQLSKEILGVELTSREILAAHENPEEFFASHPRQSSGEDEAAPVDEPVPAEESEEDNVPVEEGTAQSDLDF